MNNAKSACRYASNDPETIASWLLHRCLAPDADVPREIAACIDAVGRRDPDLLIDTACDLLHLAGRLRLAHHEAAPHWVNERGEYAFDLASDAVREGLIQPADQQLFADVCIVVAADGAGMWVHLSVLGCDDPTLRLAALIAAGRMWAIKLGAVRGSLPLAAAATVLSYSPA